MDEEKKKKEGEKEKKREEASPRVASSRLIRPRKFSAVGGEVVGGEGETIRGDRMAGRFLFSF